MLQNELHYPVYYLLVPNPVVPALNQLELFVPRRALVVENHSVLVTDQFVFLASDEVDWDVNLDDVLHRSQTKNVELVALELLH